MPPLIGLPSPTELAGRGRRRGSTRPGAPPVGAFLGEESENRLARERRALTGFFAGIPKGILEVGRLIAPGSREGEMGLGEFASGVGQSLIRTGKWVTDPVEKLRQIREGTLTETLLEDVGNVAAVFGGASAAAGRAAAGAGARAGALSRQAQKAATAAERSTLLNRSSQVADTAAQLGQVQRGLFTVATPYRFVGRKLITGPAEAARLRGAAKVGTGEQLTFGERVAPLVSLGRQRVRSRGIEAQREVAAQTFRAENDPFIQLQEQMSRRLIELDPDLPADVAGKMPTEELKFRLEGLEPVSRELRDIRARHGIQADFKRLPALRRRQDLYQDPRIQQLLGVAEQEFPRFLERADAVLPEVDPTPVRRRKPALVAEKQAKTFAREAERWERRADRTQEQLTRTQDRLQEAPAGSKTAQNAQARSSELTRRLRDARREGQRFEKRSARELKKMLRVDDAQMPLTDARYQPALHEFLSERRQLIDWFIEGELDRATLAEVLDEIPSTFLEAQARMEAIGITRPPPRVADFSAALVDSLSSGRRRLGPQPAGKAFPGQEVSAPGRRERTLGARRADAPPIEQEMLEASTGATRTTPGPEGALFGRVETTPDLFTAMAGEVAWERASNGYAQWLRDNKFLTRVAPDADLSGTGFVDFQRGANGERLVVPAKIKGMLDQFATAKNPNSLFWQGAEHFSDAFRTSVLYLSPRWHVNNALGNTFLAALDSPADVFNLPNWIEAVTEARRKKALAPGVEVSLRHTDVDPRVLEATGIRQELLSGTEVRRTPFPEKIPGVGRVAKVSAHANAWVDEAVRSLLWRGKVRRGATQKTAMGDIVDADAIFEKTRRGGKLSDAESSVVERATRESIESLVDYGNMTPWERATLRTFFPFITWQKNVAKLAMSLPVDHPLRFAAIEQLSNHFAGFSAEERESLPEYAIASIGLPGGGQISTRGANPLQDSMQLFTPEGLMQSLNPAIEAGARFITRAPATGPFGPQEVGPIGFSQPILGAESMAAGFVRDLPPFSLLRETVPGAQGLLGEPRKSPASQIGQFFGATYRPPEVVQGLQQREQEQRRRALLSRLPPAPETGGGGLISPGALALGVGGRSRSRGRPRLRSSSSTGLVSSRLTGS